MQPGTRRTTSPVFAVLAVLAATTLVVLLATWAASSGPDDVLRGPGPGARTATTTAPPAPTAGPATVATGPAHVQHPHGSGWIVIALVLVMGALVVLVVWALIALLLTEVGPIRVRRRRRIEEASPDFDVVEPVVAVLTQMVEDAQEQQQLLAAGTPRNGIVRCWTRFEHQAEQAGLPRNPAETSSEFTLRLLDLVEADGSAVVRLAGLYREARFSDHELTEVDRAAARDALEAIHRQLPSRLSFPGVR